jgi:FKBP-type peptidyl-prolyl cis-trans isomerase FkpA
VAPDPANTLPLLLVSLLFIEPVFRPRQVLRPVVQVQSTPPSVRVFLLRIIRRVPREISSGFPWPPIILAHMRSSAATGHRTMRHPPRNALPGHPVQPRSLHGRKSRADLLKRVPTTSKILPGAHFRGGPAHGLNSFRHHPSQALRAALEFRFAVTRDVAQSGSALQWGCRGRGFKSRRPDSMRPSLLVGLISYRPSHLGVHLRRTLLVVIGIGILACSRSGDRSGAPSKNGFSSSLGVDTLTMTKTPSGLRYQDVAVGQGKEAKAGSTVSVHYTGWLPNGEKFDSSRDRNQPFGFTLGAGQVIAGWDEGVAGMKIGGRRKLVIPPDLAYGTAGAPPDIPPGATLVFDVELLDVH